MLKLLNLTYDRAFLLPKRLSQI